MVAQPKNLWRVLDILSSNPTTCVVWPGAIGSAGYGITSLGGVRKNAHRLVWEQTRGPIAAGLQLDHLCRNRACVNPAHLEPVTPRVNTLRSTAVSALNVVKTHCPTGHPYDAVNTYHRPSGGRGCRTCRARSAANYELRRKRSA